MTEFMFSHECTASCRRKSCVKVDPTVLQAKAVCARCPVIMQCRVWAVMTFTEGVAGGLTEHERVLKRKELRNQGVKFVQNAPRRMRNNGSEDS